MAGVAAGDLIILIGNGNGTFQSPQHYFVGVGFMDSVNVQDLNDDGAPDVGLQSSGGFTVMLNAGGTSIALQGSTPQSQAHQPVTFTATVAATVPGAGNPTGSVTFTDISVFPVTTLGTVALKNGNAKLIKGFVPGTHSIQALYSGDATFNPHASEVVKLEVSASGGGGGGGGGGSGGGACSTLPAAAQSKARRTARPVVAAGSSVIGGPAAAAAKLGPSVAGEQRQVPRLPKPFIASSKSRLALHAVSAAELVGLTESVLGFDGISHFEQRTIPDNGNQATLEPPDMALAVSDTQVLQVVNGALAVYSADGTRLAGPLSLNRFFGQASSVVREGQTKTFGPFVADPRAFFDASTQRWFITALKVEADPASGAWGDKSSILLAVSQTADATGAFLHYSIDVTDADFGDCPCLGDQPLLGMNGDAIFLSTNQFSLKGRQFQTALVLAIDKRKLLRREKVVALGFQNLTAGGLPAFSVHPANLPPGAQSPGVEYFLSTLNFDGAGDDRVAVWAMSDTNRIAVANGAFVQMQNLVVEVQPYSQPGPVSQMQGPTPLRDSLNSQGFDEALQLLDGNDDRMQQVYHAGGELIATFGTSVQLENSTTQMGVAWLRIGTTTQSCGLAASVNQQGHLALEGKDLLFPAVAVNADGEGVIAFNVVGTDLFPSFGYSRLSLAGVDSDVHLAATGSAPEDGFSGYRPFGGRGVSRWGDYSAAAVSPNGHFWIAGEYIPATERTEFANWGSFIARIPPPE